MGRASIETCELCGIPLDGYLNGSYQKMADYNGLCVEVGYSVGGWGYRKDHIRKFSGEVCIPCYEAVMPAVVALRDALAERRPQRARKDFLQLGKGSRAQ